MPTGAPAIAASAAPIVTGSILGPLTRQAQTGSTAGLDTHLGVYRDSKRTKSPPACSSWRNIWSTNRATTSTAG